MVELLAVGVHIVRQGGVGPGDSVVVMGAGPVGLLCAAVAKAFGASKVVSVDIVPSKLEFAKTIGATHTYTSQRLPPADNAKNIISECELRRRGRRRHRRVGRGALYPGEPSRREARRDVRAGRDGQERHQLPHHGAVPEGGHGQGGASGMARGITSSRCSCWGAGWWM